MRRLTAVGAGAGVLLAASVASAQPARGAFGQQGQFIVSADRLFSLFSWSRLSQDDFNATPGTKSTTTTNGTAISLLWGSNQLVDSNGNVLISPFAVPRVGVDYVIVPHVTIGGNVVLFFTLGGSTSTDMNNNGVTTSASVDNPGQILFGIEPRAGYILPLTDMFSLWLRGGFSYYVDSTKLTQGAGAGQQTQTVTLNQFALDLEPQIVFTAIPHVGFTAGLTGDIPITGGHSLDTNANGVSTSVSAWSGVAFFGVTLGMFAYF